LLGLLRYWPRQGWRNAGLCCSDTEVRCGGCYFDGAEPVLGALISSNAGGVNWHHNPSIMAKLFRSSISLCAAIASVAVAAGSVAAQGTIDLIFEVDGQRFQNQDIRHELAVGETSVTVGVSYEVSTRKAFRVNAFAGSRQVGEECLFSTTGIDCNRLEVPSR